MRPYLFLLLLVIGFNAFSQNLKFEHLGTDEGLSQSNITCMLQDRNGFMWFGTHDGLNRYDGYKFTVYRSNVNDKNSLSSNFITDLVEDNERNLWIATCGGGLNLFIANEEKFISYRYDESDRQGIASDYVNSLCLDSSGSLWVGTDKGL